MKNLLLYACCLLSTAVLAATNLVSNAVTVTNRCATIVTYTMDTNGVAHVNDPTGRLIGTAEERALKIAADGQIDIASAAADAAGTAREEWDDFMATNDSHIVYISADFAPLPPTSADGSPGRITTARPTITTSGSTGRSTIRRRSPRESSTSAAPTGLTQPGRTGTTWKWCAA